MKFSLINVQSEAKGKVSGGLIQNHIGTLESATDAAIATEKANSNAINIAVVDEVTNRIGDQCEGRKRLDTRRTNCPLCESFCVDCTPDEDEYGLPCDRFIQVPAPNPAVAAAVRAAYPDGVKVTLCPVD